MGLISKLFKSRPPAAEGGERAPDAPSGDGAAQPPGAPIPTPVVMPAYVPPDARPTPVDVFDRPTVRALDSIDDADRPTIVLPESTAAELARSTATASPPTPPVPRPTARGGPRPAAPARPPPVPRPRAPVVDAASRPGAAKVRTPPKPPPTPRSGTRLTETAGMGDVDRGFAAIESKGARSASPGTLETDLSEVHTLFAELATNHVRQLRDFMIELRWGPTPSTWVAVCEPSVESLRRAAEKVELGPLVSGLGDLQAAMRAVDVTTASMIDGPARDRILAAHDTLVGVLPDTFALDGDRSRREAAILHALLAQIPDVRKVTIDKLYAAGLTTLETMQLATVEDLVTTTDIPEDLAARIVERFRRYREEVASMAVDETRAHERARIAELVHQLRRQNEEFDRAASAWTEDAIQRKKDVLVARGQTMLAIDLQLARLGEVALVRELERLPYVRKVAELERFLSEADRTYAGAARAASGSSSRARR